MDRLRCMEVFVEVARDGSFTGAARRLGMSKASVTKHVAWLEHSLRARLLNRTTKQVGLTEAGRALREAFLKLDPRKLAGNPVILTTEIVAILATLSAAIAIGHGAGAGFAIQVAAWLWAPVLFANFAESIAEGRGKAAADSLRATRVTTKAKLIVDPKTGTIVPTPAHLLGVGEYEL